MTRDESSGDDGTRGVEEAGGDTDDGPRDANADSGGTVVGPDRREVGVPLRVYKAVTVVSTLVTLAAVVAGFVLLDVATDRGRAPPSEVDLPLALAGLAAIALGAVLYAFGTRFRAEDRTGNVNDGSDESQVDG